ncbi:helix-turn-helix transcriptional regulator [Flavobacterium sp. MAH-1]|uniref:Helix-turn-helix transcriptional regulator n=1 Tax=Flavobacterium agri TaxID=2743471 RepID=A0A7Y8Y0E0_9FLAO|nr:helix-turn-helix transcriptional regulator [Flavobacterium agri]NUY80261.1 helix-turn-helix transcriptional regulator [Flavobacterium agri]NYA70286.1 helix-turn-helix transcriptional regulator [Flavobacterium agri]
METPTKHIGRKISRIRELRNMKQEYLAQELGISQQSVSNIENSESVDEERLRQIAEVLGVTSEAIKNFSEEAIFNIIGNTYHDNSSSLNYNCTFNPLDELLKSHEENKQLYERLLQAEREKATLYENLYKSK